MDGKMEVMKRFLKEEGKEDELEAFLASELNVAQTLEKGSENERVVLFGHPSRSVRVQYSKKGKIQSIKCDSALANDLAKKIEDAIYSDSGISVDRCLVFLGNKPDGFWRMGNSFQIGNPPVFAGAWT